MHTSKHSVEKSRYPYLLGTANKICRLPQAPLDAESATSIYPRGL
jgi:hypothetical protein